MCTLQFVVISRFELCFVALRQRQHRRPICHLCNVHITKHNNRYADFLSLSPPPAIVAVHDQISGHANYLSVYIPVSLGGMLTTLGGRVRFLRRFCLPLVKDADCRVLLAGRPIFSPPLSVAFIYPLLIGRAKVSPLQPFQRVSTRPTCVTQRPQVKTRRSMRCHESCALSMRLTGPR